MIIRLTSLALFVISSVCGCAGGTGTGTTLKKDWPPQFKQMSKPNDITPLTGTTFKWGESSCLLLGVKESDDPKTRKLAEQFSNKWFMSVGNYISAYNSSNELMTNDGTPVVWIRGYDSYLSCLNEELVRAGLVEIDEEQWHGYSFTSPTKEGSKVEDWHGQLRKAKEGYKNGEALKILFNWSP